MVKKMNGKRSISSKNGLTAKRSYRTAVILSCMLVMEITILTGKEVNIAAFLVEQATTR